MFVVNNMRNTERNVLLGERHVTIVKVKITFNPNARKNTQCHGPKMEMTIMMTSGSWL